MVAFMAATDCHNAKLCCIFWLVIVTSEPVILYVKTLLFPYALLYIYQLCISSAT